MAGMTTQPDGTTATTGSRYVEAVTINGRKHYGVDMRPAAGGGHGGYALCDPGVLVFDQEFVWVSGLRFRGKPLVSMTLCAKCRSVGEWW